jgi:Tol biopolymer transport system component
MVFVWYLVRLVAVDKLARGFNAREMTMPFAVSPDGRTIVFVAGPPGGPYFLYARTLDDTRPRRIEGTENGMTPAISPDGEWVAFLVRSSQIRKVRLAGGPAIDGRLIYTRADGNLMAVPFDATSLRVTGPPVELADRVESSPMGTRVALSAGGTLVYRTGSSGARLALVHANGTVSPLGELEGGMGLPRVSPDGRRIAVAMTDGSGSAALTDLWLFDRSSGQATRLTRTGHAGMPEWTADGRRLLFVSGPRGGRSEIWSLPLDGSAGPSRLVEIDGTPLHAVPTPGLGSSARLRRTRLGRGADGHSAAHRRLASVRSNDLRSRSRWRDLRLPCPEPYRLRGAGSGPLVRGDPSPLSPCGVDGGSAMSLQLQRGNIWRLRLKETDGASRPVPGSARTRSPPSSARASAGVRLDPSSP